MDKALKCYTHTWALNEYMLEVNKPPIMRRVDRLMAGQQVDEFNLANVAKREFVNSLDRCGALFRSCEFPIDKYVEIRGTYILVIWRLIEEEIKIFRERSGMPYYAKSLEWWAMEISNFLEKKTDDYYKKRDRLNKL